MTAQAWGSSVEYRQKKRRKHKTQVLILETAGTSMPSFLCHKMCFFHWQAAGGPCVCEIKTEKKGGTIMTNIDYCGIVNLLRQLVEKNLMTRTEAK